MLHATVFIVHHDDAYLGNKNNNEGQLLAPRTPTTSAPSRSPFEHFHPFVLIWTNTLLKHLLISNS